MSIQPKQRPIIFSTDMVRAILAGKKTQTRRIVKLPDFSQSQTNGYDWTYRDKRALWNDISNAQLLTKCPYGVVGDQLWVRETYFPATNQQGSEVFVYKADQDDEWIADFADEGCGGWKPSIFMPRAASRILLEITNIRVERVQDISEQDAIAEGSYIGRCPCNEMQAKPITPIEATFNQTWCHIHGDEYSHLFKKINGDDAWESNPYVWVVEFKRVGGAS